MLRGHANTAVNATQARVVLADGTISTVSECSRPDLFYALRGGGGGYAVITDLTYRSYPSPTTITDVSWYGKVESGDPADILAAAVEVLRAADGVAAAHQGWNGGMTIPTLASPSFSIGLTTYNGNASAGEALLSGLSAWVAAQPKSMKVSGSGRTSSQQRPEGGWAKPGAPEGQVPWN